MKIIILNPLLKVKGVQSTESNDHGNKNHLRKGERTKMRPKYLDDYVSVMNDDDSDKINVLRYMV